MAAELGSRCKGASSSILGFPSAIAMPSPFSAPLIVMLVEPILSSLFVSLYLVAAVAVAPCPELAVLPLSVNECVAAAFSCTSEVFGGGPQLTGPSHTGACCAAPGAPCLAWHSSRLMAPMADC